MLRQLAFLLALGFAPQACASNHGQGTRAVRRVEPVTRSPNDSHVAQELAPQKNAKRAFNQVYARACRGSITPPVVAPSATQFVYCDAVFDLPTGAYLGRARLGVSAYNDEEHVVATNYEQGGFLWNASPFDARDAGTLVPGEFMTGIAVNAKLGLVVDVESGTESVGVALRSIADWRVRGSARLFDQGPATKGRVSFLADGRAVVLEGHRLVELTGDGLSPIGAPFEDLQAAVVSADGQRAVLTGSNGSRALVDTVSKSRVAVLPPVSAEPAPESPVALDATGGRLAYLDRGNLTLVAVSNLGALEVLFAEPTRHPDALVLSADGHVLFVEERGEARVLREGAPRRGQPAARYDLDLPDGFRSAERREELLSFDGFVDEERIVPAGFVGLFRNEATSVEVEVTATEASEFGGESNLETWAARVAARENVSMDTSTFKLWASPSGRAFEFVWFRREGCDPADLYARFIERDDWLYRILVTVPPGTPLKRIHPLLHQFFDAPTGPASEQRALLAPPPFERQPC